MKPDFLRYFYKCMAAWGLVGILPSFLASGKQGFLGFVFGFGCIAVIIGSWDITLRFTLKPRKTNTAWESLFVFVHYGLLGGLFYAIIRWFVVSWPWFFAGATTILPGMLTAVFLFKDEQPVEQKE